MKKILLGAAVLGVAYALSDKNTRDKMVSFVKDWSDKLQGFVNTNVPENWKETAKKTAQNVVGYKRGSQPFASY